MPEEKSFVFLIMLGRSVNYNEIEPVQDDVIPQKAITFYSAAI